jgi:periplasmic protein TonB
MPATPSPAARTTPSRRTWLIAAAFAAGLLLFLVLWLDQRDDRGFYRGRPDAAPAPGQVFKPLPAPTPDTNRPGVRTPADGPDFSRGAPATPPASPRSVPSPEPRSPAAPQAPAAPATAPVAVETPPPRYPPSALRRGVSGEVLLRVTVDTQGLPGDIEVIQSSGSRDLDRAATTAARRWRFRPALREGVPVEGAVNVPIVFDSQR